MNPITKSIILSPVNLLYDISPTAALKLLYRIKQKRKLDLNNPQSYSEKLQWIKVYYKNPLLTKLVDKYTVRGCVKKKCPEILVPLLWQGFDARDIPWKKLPEKFVIKVTHGSGFNIICTDKDKIDKEDVVAKTDKWLKSKFIKCYGEWFYGVERPRIIIEQYLENGTGDVPEDYKIMCFDGHPQYIVVDTDRYKGHKRNLYNTDWTFRSDVSLGFPNDVAIVPPSSEITSKLLKYAEELSKGFPHVRVDLYIVNNRIYFGEMTFTNGAGFDRVKPVEFDLEMGKHFILPQRNGNNRRDKVK